MNSLPSIVGQLRKVGFGALLGSGSLLLLKEMISNQMLNGMQFYHLIFVGTSAGAGIQLFLESTALGWFAADIANQIGLTCYCIILRAVADRSTFERRREEARRALSNRRLPLSAERTNEEEEFREFVISELILHEDRIDQLEQEFESHCNSH